jgi:hypothetical protein
MLLPYSSGRITDSFSGGSNSQVYIIQDLHCHAQVQRNIANILSSLDKQFHLKNVFVEGAVGQVDTSWINLVKDKAAGNRLAEAMLNSGRLTGSEYYSIISGKPELLMGIENPGRYFSNIQRLSGIVQKHSMLELQFREIDNEISKLEKTYLSAGNNKIGRLAKKFADGIISSKKYYAILLKTAKKNGLQINVPVMKEYLNLSESNKKLDIIKIKTINPFSLIVEEKQLLAELRKRMAECNAEKDVVFISEYFNQLKACLKGKISASDYDYLKQNFNRFNMHWAKYIGSDRINMLSPYFDLMKKYYEINIARNYDFVEKSLEITGDSQKAIVIIAGGFHSKGITEILKEKNISYVVVTPDFSDGSEYAQNVYDKILQEEMRSIPKNTLNLWVESQMIIAQSLSEENKKKVMLNIQSYCLKAITEYKDEGKITESEYAEILNNLNNIIARKCTESYVELFSDPNDAVKNANQVLNKLGSEISLIGIDGDEIRYKIKSNLAGANNRYSIIATYNKKKQELVWGDKKKLVKKNKSSFNIVKFMLMNITVPLLGFAVVPDSAPNIKDDKIVNDIKNRLDYCFAAARDFTYLVSGEKYNSISLLSADRESIVDAFLKLIEYMRKHDYNESLLIEGMPDMMRCSQRKSGYFLDNLWAEILLEKLSKKEKWDSNNWFKTRKNDLNNFIIDTSFLRYLCITDNNCLAYLLFNTDSINETDFKKIFYEFTDPPESISDYDWVKLFGITIVLIKRVIDNNNFVSDKVKEEYKNKILDLYKKDTAFRKYKYFYNALKGGSDSNDFEDYEIVNDINDRLNDCCSAARDFTYLVSNEDYESISLSFSDREGLIDTFLKILEYMRKHNYNESLLIDAIPGMMECYQLKSGCVIKDLWAENLLKDLRTETEFYLYTWFRKRKDNFNKFVTHDLLRDRCIGSDDSIAYLLLNTDSINETNLKIIFDEFTEPPESTSKDNRVKLFGITIVLIKRVIDNNNIVSDKVKEEYKNKILFLYEKDAAFRKYKYFYNALKGDGDDNEITPNKKNFLMSFFSKSDETAAVLAAAEKRAFNILAYRYSDAVRKNQDVIKKVTDVFIKKRNFAKIGDINAAAENSKWDFNVMSENENKMFLKRIIQRYTSDDRMVATVHSFVKKGTMANLTIAEIEQKILKLKQYYRDKDNKPEICKNIINYMYSRISERFTQISDLISNNEALNNEYFTLENIINIVENDDNYRNYINVGFYKRKDLKKLIYAVLKADYPKEIMIYLKKNKYIDYIVQLILNRDKTNNTVIITKEVDDLINNIPIDAKLTDILYEQKKHNETENTDIRILSFGEPATLSSDDKLPVIDEAIKEAKKSMAAGEPFIKTLLKDNNMSLKKLQNYGKVINCTNEDCLDCKDLCKATDDTNAANIYCLVAETDIGKIYIYLYEPCHKLNDLTMSTLDADFANTVIKWIINNDSKLQEMGLKSINLSLKAVNENTVFEEIEEIQTAG